jgi:hypothetical protein
MFPIFSQKCRKISLKMTRNFATKYSFKIFEAENLSQKKLLVVNNKYFYVNEIEISIY